MIVRKGFVKVTCFISDFETLIPESEYYKKTGDTKAYSVASVKTHLAYDKKEKNWYCDFEGKEGKEYFSKTIHNVDGVIEDFFSFFMNMRNIKKYKLGLHQVHYFHNGGKFDFYFILPWLRNNGTVTLNSELPSKERETNKLYFSVLWSDTYRSITVFKYLKDGDRDRKITIEFRDSYYLFKSPVKALAKEVGMEKGDTLKAISKAQLGNVTTEELYADDELNKYILDDCLIVAKYFELMCVNFPKSSVLPTTVASFAKSMYLTDKGVEGMKPVDAFRNYVMFLTPEKQAEYNDIFVEWYTGGLTSVQEKSLFQTVEDVIIEDVTSQYPDKMRNFKMPTGKFIEIRSEWEWERYKKENKERLDSGDIPCFINYNYKSVEQTTKVPNLLKGLKRRDVTDIGNMSTMGYSTSVYRTNVKECYLYYKEFEKLISYESKEFVVAYVFEYGNFIFTDYIDKYYKMKTEGKKENNNAKKATGKLMLNSLYGKFGEKGERLCQFYPELIEVLEKQKGEKRVLEVKKEKVTDGLGMVNVVTSSDSPMTYFQIAGYITSLARYWLLKRWNEIIELGGEVHYCDTDSNFITLPKENYDKLKHGSNLGEWDLEKPKKSDKMTYDYLFIQAPKSYITFHKGDIIDKNGCKGIDKAVMESCGVKHFLRNNIYNVRERLILKNGVILVDKPKYSVTPVTVELIKEEIGSKYNLSYKTY